MNVQNLAAALRGGPIQQDRLLKLDTPLGPNALVVQRAVGHSTIGRDYIFTLDVVSLDSTIELKKLIAQPVTSGSSRQAAAIAQSTAMSIPRVGWAPMAVSQRIRSRCKRGCTY
ncbi:hypothetical protein WK71_02465 [Burkholderia ubonensis]|nr:hypothetical protein WK71_02465 [Burkholderia ubonensis]